MPEGLRAAAERAAWSRDETSVAVRVVFFTALFCVARLILSAWLASSRDDLQRIVKGTKAVSAVHAMVQSAAITWVVLRDATMAPIIASIARFERPSTDVELVAVQSEIVGLLATAAAGEFLFQAPISARLSARATLASCQPRY